MADRTIKLSKELTQKGAALAAADERGVAAQAKLDARTMRLAELKNQEAEINSRIAAAPDKDVPPLKRERMENIADQEILGIQIEASAAEAEATKQARLGVGRGFRDEKRKYVTDLAAELAEEYMATAGQLVPIARKLIACRLFGGAHSVRLDLSSPIVDHPLVDGRGLRVCASGDHGERIVELRADPEAAPLIAILDELATTERQTELLKRQAEAERDQRRLDAAAAQKAAG